jgi:hypothetical protein
LYIAYGKLQDEKSGVKRDGEVKNGYFSTNLLIRCYGSEEDMKYGFITPYLTAPYKSD